MSKAVIQAVGENSSEESQLPTFCPQAKTGPTSDGDGGAHKVGDTEARQTMRTHDNDEPKQVVLC